MKEKEKSLGIIKNIEGEVVSSDPLITILVFPEPISSRCDIKLNAAIKEVTGCNDCPLLDTMWDICNASDTLGEIEYKADEDGENGKYITPDNCPLKEKPVLVKLKV